MDLILYHGKCMDGWAAAYIASKKYPKAVLMPQLYGSEPPYQAVEGKDVLVVDFSWNKREINDKLASLAKSFHILDHHKSAKELLADAPYARFDMTRSGAGLTWDYLFGYEDFRNGKWDDPILNVVKPEGLPRPWWVNYVEDYDLWNKKLPNTNEINAYLHALPHTAADWDTLNVEGHTAQQDAIDNIIAVGEGMLKQQEYQVRAMMAVANSGRGWGLTIGVANAPYFMSSDLGHELAKTHDVGMTWYQRKDGKIIFSLRSIGDIDVSKLAKKMGGGGHKNSAGFELPQGEARVMLRLIIKAGMDEHTS